MRRATLSNGRAQIVLGDKTSHGGVVISGSPTNTWNGIPVVRKADMVTCPKCSPHIFEVAEGLENCTDTNAHLPMTTEGHKTTCGAILIAQPAGPYSLERALNPGKELSHDEQVLLKDSKGMPLPDVYYTAKMASGELIFGCTDAEGKTKRFATDGAQKIEIYFGHIEQGEEA